MKFYFLSPYDLLRTRVNQVAAMRFCEGLGENGSATELIVPHYFRLGNMRINQVFDYYRVRQTFRIKVFLTLLWDNAPLLYTLVVLYFVSFMSLLRIILINIRGLSGVVLISQSVDLLLVPALIMKRMRFLSKARVVFYAHEVIYKRRYVWIYKNADAIICTNTKIIEDLVRDFDISENKLALFSNPISDSTLESWIDRSTARQKIGYTNSHPPLVVYTGKLGVELREPQFLLDAASRLPQYQFIFTGGKAHVVRYFRKLCLQRKISNVEFTGYVLDSGRIRYYQFAADVLVSFYTEKDHLVNYNFPLKVSEYMATRNPIVMPNHPATRDVINSGNAILVEPESLEALVGGIRRAIENKEESARLAEQAFRDVQQLSAKRQCQRLLEFFNE
jgi:glycosyltransferase involved in cell wall biosynthesis